MVSKTVHTEPILFSGLEQELKKIAAVCRFVSSVCGHPDCRRAISEDCIILDDIANYGKEGFGHIILPKKRVQVEAVQRLAGYSRYAVAALKGQANLTYDEINAVEDRISDILAAYRTITGDSVKVSYDDDCLHDKNIETLF